jgi:hypothetical protein
MPSFFMTSDMPCTLHLSMLDAKQGRRTCLKRISETPVEARSIGAATAQFSNYAGQGFSTDSKNAFISAA